MVLQTLHRNFLIRVYHGLNLSTKIKLKCLQRLPYSHHNQNALEIAERGGKMYDKFVSFVENLEKVGKNIDQAKNSYNDAFKQLTTGNDNLVTQTQKLKQLGAKNRKNLPSTLIENTENQIDFSE